MARILLSAYACEPAIGSEPGVGWNTAVEIAKLHDTWVITRQNNRAAIEAVLDVQPIPRLKFIYFDFPTWARFWKRGHLGIQVYYYLWQFGARATVLRLFSKYQFDLVHHLTFGRYWSPSLLSTLPSPFLWGPLGGGESTPNMLHKTLSWRGRAYEAARNTARWLGERDPFVHMTASNTDLALATTDETATKLRRLGVPEVRIWPQAVLTDTELENLAAIPIRRGKGARFVSVGRLVNWKGFHLALRAFARISAGCPQSEYWIINDGPERKRLEMLALRLGLSDRVRFFGRLASLTHVYEKLAQCDVLIHPALHEAFGVVCLEAMAAGRPVICLDTGGPAMIVTDSTGFKIPPTSPAQTISQLSEAMLRLAKDPTLRRDLAIGARSRVKQDLTWGHQRGRLNALYLNVIGRQRGL